MFAPAMKLTLQADYGLRVLLFLALRPGDVVPIGEIAAAYGVSAHHLMKVAQLLARQGFVELLRGVHGGVRLARAPEAIALGEVVRATEPSMALVECFDPATNTCVIAPVCELKKILADAQRAFLAELDRHTLADAAKRPRALTALLVPEATLSAKARR